MLYQLFFLIFIRQVKIKLFPKDGKKVLAHFQLYKTESPMEEATHEYRHYGILIQGIKAIYENSFLDESLNNESILKSCKKTNKHDTKIIGDKIVKRTRETIKSKARFFILYH